MMKKMKETKNGAKIFQSTYEPHFSKGIIEQDMNLKGQLEKFASPKGKLSKFFQYNSLGFPVKNKDSSILTSFSGGQKFASAVY